jgi:hypothetical protein
MLVSNKLCIAVCVGLLAFSFGNAARADDVTLMGFISCGKCTLKQTTKCSNAIQVEEGGKTTTYFFVDQGVKEKYHADICGAGKKAGKVTGTVSEKDGKKWITPKKVEYTGATTGSRTPPEWNRSYSDALAAAKKSRKPLAVFLASGEAGWNKVAREGELSGKVEDLLKEQYVCLYLDSESAHGKAMASAFEVSGGVGLVISDAAGATQAFHHRGTLPATDLASCLSRCCASTAKANCPLCVLADMEHEGMATTPVTATPAAHCPNCPAAAATAPASVNAAAHQPVAATAGGSCCGKR